MKHGADQAGTDKATDRRDGGERLAALERLAAGFGPCRGLVRRVVGRLAEREWTFAEIVPATAVSRRTIEEVLATLGTDVRQERSADTRATFRLRAEAIDAYRAFAAGPAACPPEGRLVGDALVAELKRLVAAAPGARQALDHVSATPATAARRAEWLATTYELPSSRMLCVGDHDLTALAACLREPRLRALVVDVDDELLGYIERQATRLGLDIRCRYADLRFGLPAEAEEWADIAFTDPPYTPEGVGLFAARAVRGLRDRAFGQIVIAYGVGERHPGLKLRTQQALGRLGLVLDAVLPDFSVYEGAQAIGSHSDLYVCRPTSRSWRLAADPMAAGQHDRTLIYTHGPQSLEAARAPLHERVTTALSRFATDDGATPLTAVIGDQLTSLVSIGDESERRTEARVPDVPTLDLAHVLQRGLPAAVARLDGAIAAEALADPGGWLARLLLAVNVRRLVVLLRNGHPDLASATAQQALRRLLGAKYQLTSRRSTPDPTHAVLVAERVAAAGLDTAARLTRHVLDRAWQPLVPSLRDGMLRVAGAKRADVDTYARAQELARRLAGDADPIATTLLDLPRQRLSALIDALSDWEAHELTGRQ